MITDEKITVAEIEELCAQLVKAEATLLELYTKEMPPELLEALGLLWDCCLNYQTTYENFSHE